MTVNPKANAALVEALGSALREGEHGLRTGPALLVRVLREESWCSFVTQRGDQVEHQRFEHFVTTPPLKGLGASMRLIEKMLDSIEMETERVAARDLLDRVTQKPRGGSKEINLNVDNIHNENDLGRPSGTSTAAALRRLRKDAPELHAEVLAGHLSAHAAMVKAGFRRKAVSVPVDRPEMVAKTLRKSLTPEDLATLIELLGRPSDA